MNLTELKSEMMIKILNLSAFIWEYLIILLLSRNGSSRLFHELIQQILLITYYESVIFLGTWVP